MTEAAFKAAQGAAAGPAPQLGSGGSGSGGGSSEAGLRRRFRTSGAESSIWVRQVAPAVLLLTTTALFISIARGSLHPQGLMQLSRLSIGSEQANATVASQVDAAGAGQQQASAAVAQQQAGGTATSDQQPESTAATSNQQLQDATATSDQQPKDAAAAGQEASANAEDQQQAGAKAADQQQAGAKATGEQPLLTVADQQEATWQSLADGPETEVLPCRESGYCSVGKLQPYVGEIDSLEGFKKALNASCYKKECFHITIGTSGHLIAMSFLTQAWKLGLANVMIHAKTQESCERLAAAGYNNVTCVWTYRDWIAQAPGSPYIVQESIEQWAIRYILFARAVWLGYNVFMLDNDSWLYRDPYLYLKKAPLANISFLTLQDGGAQLNGGASYIHNARPGGPAWWTIAAVAERLIFVKENWDWFQKNLERPVALTHAMMDQPVLSDIIVWQHLGFPAMPFSQFDSPQVNTSYIHSKMDYGPKFRVTYPPEWKAVTGGATEEMLTAFRLTIPFQNGTWPELGMGPRFPAAGNFSKSFIQTLEEESGYKYYDAFGSPPPGFEMPPNEMWAFTPGWFLSSWLARGINGVWESGPPPAQVMIHLIFIPGLGPLKKEALLKSHNAWSFEASQAIEGRLFASSTPEQQLPRVLSLLPGTRLEASSPKDYRDKTAQLVRLALRLGRVLNMPEPICRNQSWISRPQYIIDQPDVVDPNTGKSHKRFITNIGWLLSYGLDDDYHCIWWEYLEKQCMQSYLVHFDYKELVRRLPPGAGEPSPDNTVQLEAGATLQKALEAAAKKEAPHILFLSSLPDLSAPLPDGEGEVDKQFQDWSQTCHWMQQVPELRERRRRRLGELEHLWGHELLRASWGV